MFNNKGKVEFPFLEIWKNRTWFHNKKGQYKFTFFFKRKIGHGGSFSHKWNGIVLIDIFTFPKYRIPFQVKLCYDIAYRPVKIEYFFPNTDKK